MGGLDAMRETFGDSDGPPEGLAILIVLFLVACCLVAFVRVLREAVGRPDMWPALAGAFAFWPLAFSGRVYLAMGAMLGGLIATSFLSDIREKRAKRRKET
jgi:hypothetical protein